LFNVENIKFNVEKSGFLLLGLSNERLEPELIAPPTRPPDVLQLQDLDAPPIDHVEQQCRVAERSADKVHVFQAYR
jgi:hypothetical protein